MLGLEFLKSEKGLGKMTIAGMEFMDYQSDALYKKMVAMLDTIMVQEDGKWKIPVDRASLAVLQDTILAETGINTKLIPTPEEPGMMAISAGFMNPGNLLNMKDAELIIEAKHSSIGEAFKALKVDVLKGWVDTSTGKIGGDYSKIEFGLYVGTYIDDILSEAFLKRYKLTMSQGLAAVLLHELGHVFSGFLFITRSVIDPIMVDIAVKMATRKGVYGKERVTIIRDAMATLECGTPVKEDQLDKMDSQGLTVLFNKAISTRDVRRTLSLGTQERSSEIYADLYAVRFGCPKQAVAALASFSGGALSKKILAVSTVVCIQLGVMFPLFAGFLMLTPLFFILDRLTGTLTGNSVYDSPYRRMKNLLRDHVIRINADIDIDKRNKVKMIADAKEMEKMIEDAKSSLEGTFVQRYIGWINSGSDFKAQEFEHYTDELIGHTLSLYKDHFKD